MLFDTRSRVVSHVLSKTYSVGLELASISVDDIEKDLGIPRSTAGDAVRYLVAAGALVEYRDPTHSQRRLLGLGDYTKWLSDDAMIRARVKAKPAPPSGPTLFDGVEPSGPAGRSTETNRPAPPDGTTGNRPAPPDGTVRPHRTVAILKTNSNNHLVGPPVTTIRSLETTTTVDAVVAVLQGVYHDEPGRALELAGLVEKASTGRDEALARVRALVLESSKPGIDDSKQFVGWAISHGKWGAKAPAQRGAGASAQRPTGPDDATVTAIVTEFLTLAGDGARVALGSDPPLQVAHVHRLPSIGCSSTGCPRRIALRILELGGRPGVVRDYVQVLEEMSVSRQEGAA